MDYQIDAKGKICPVPVIMAKNEIDKGRENFSILVDSPISVENLNRFASNNGYETNVTNKESDFVISFVKQQNPWNPSITTTNNSWAVFVGNESLGMGDLELGSTLIKMFFYTLVQDRNIPAFVIFMNSGVKLPVEDEQIAEHLKALHEKGTEILICGTCLNFYKIAEKLQVGTVSNMYDIVDAMKAVNKVITI